MTVSTPQVKKELVKFSIDASDFKNCLNQVRAGTTSTTHPILSNVLFEVIESVLFLTSFDLVKRIETNFDLEGEEINIDPCCINFKILSDIVSICEGSITVIKEEDFIILKNRESTYRLPLLSASEFPDMEIGQDKQVTIQGLKHDFISYLIEACNFASTDTSKIAITGVNVQITKGIGEAQIAATNGHRLYVNSVPISSEEAIADINIILPAQVIKDCAHIVKKSEQSIIKLYPKGFEIKADKTSILSRIYDDQYPNWPKLIPEHFEYNISVDSKEMLQFLKSFSPLREQKQGALVLTVDLMPTELKAVYESEFGKINSRCECLTNQDFKNFLFYFNELYLTEGFSLFAKHYEECAYVDLNFNTTTSAIVLESGTNNLLYLLMPLQGKA